MVIPFRSIARLLARTIYPAPRVDLSALQTVLPSLQQGSYDSGILITVNHYFAQDFRSWWIVILISAYIPVKIHWVVASGWTNSGWLTNFTYWLFPRGARLLGFTPMPPMPPNPAETELRAVAVWQVMDYAIHTENPVIGMAPEGRDIPDGVLGTLPPGVGRFMYLLSKYCPQVWPVGIWKENGCIYLKFGSPYSLDIPKGLTVDERDWLVGDIIMRHIAELLPMKLRGRYT